MAPHSEQMTVNPSIVGSASSIVKLIKRLALPSVSGNGKCLINPLPLRFEDGSVYTEAASSYKATVAWGKLSCNAMGSGDVCIDPDEVIKFLNQFGSEDVTIEFGDDIVIEGEHKTASLQSESAPPPFLGRTPEKDGHKYILKKGESTTVVSTTAEEMRRPIADAKVVGVQTYTLTFSPEGSFVDVGGLHERGREIRNRIDAIVSGDPVEVRIGMDYAAVFTFTSGPVTIFTAEDWGIIVETQDGLRYLVTKRVD